MEDLKIINDIYGKLTTGSVTLLRFGSVLVQLVVEKRVGEFTHLVNVRFEILK